MAQELTILNAPRQGDLLPRIDHLVYAAPELDEGVAKVQELLGVRAQAGGRHPEWGTHNALVGLGARLYLEIVAPDPRRESRAPPTLFGLEGLTTPRLMTWAARTSDVEASRTRTGTAEGFLGDVLEGSRCTPDGRRLTWRLTDPRTVAGDGLVPFLIDWGETKHPARGLPAGGRLTSLRGVHPDPRRIEEMLRALHLPLPVERGSAPALVARIRTDRGEVELE